MAHDYPKITTFLGEKIDTSSNDPRHILKQCLQISVEKELEDVFQMYGFRITRVVVDHDDYDYGFRFGIEVVHLPTKEFLQCSEHVSRVEFENEFRFSMGLGTASHFINTRFVMAINHLSKTLRRQIESFVKDKPMVARNTCWIDPDSTLSSNSFTTATISMDRFSSNYYNTDITPNKIRQELGFPKLEDISGEVVITKKTTKGRGSLEKKFSAIEKLIAESKKRLVSEYIQPTFAFEHF